MKSQWNDADAARCRDALALRAYSSRLLGGDPTLVLHGGGNTSLKVDENDAKALYVKGTGSDLAQVDERAFTPLRLNEVLQVLQDEPSDTGGMMQALDACIVRRPAPRPSIETLLHAGLPFRYVEHTHADAVLAALNVDTIETVQREIYGDRAPLVPYHHSGQTLARACVETFASQGTPNTIGLVLAFHGVVAFGDDARSAYEHMIELVTRAEHYLQSRDAWDLPATADLPDDDAADTLDEVHGAINAIAGATLQQCVVRDAQCMAFVQRHDLGDITQRGPATPQHAVYTRRVPMLGYGEDKVSAYAANYRAYLDQHLGASASALMDAAPRIVLDPAIGLCAFGDTARTAQIAAEMYQHDMAIIARASRHGRYRSASAAAIAQAEFEYGGYAAQRRRA